MKKSIALILLLSTVVLATEAQTMFRSNGTGGGTWNVNATWEQSTNGGVSWVPALSTPTSASGTIQIRLTDVVTIGSPVTIDETTVDPAATLSVSNNISATLASASSLTINGTINFSGEGYLFGAGGFTLNGVAQLGSLNYYGAMFTGTSYGNIRCSGTRTYNSGSRVIYAGAGAQIMGSGHPSSAGVITEINNSSGVTFSNLTTGNSIATMIIPSDLILTSGDFNFVTSATSGGVVRILQIEGDITSNGNNINISGANSDVVINGTGPLSVPVSIGSTTRNLTVNRSSGTVSFNGLAITGTATVNSGTLAFLGATSIVGNVTLASGTVIAFDGQSLSFAGNFTSSGKLSASGASSLTLTGNTALTSPIDFLSTNKTLQNLTINKANAGTSVTVSSPLNVTNLTIARGTLSNVGGNLNLIGSPTITLDSSGKIITSEPTGGPWNLAYTGTVNVTPGLEIPVSGSLLSLSSSNTNTVTLGQALTIGAGGITLNAGTINCGAHAISSTSLTVNAGTFIAPSTTLTLTGDVSMAGTYTSNSGTLIFSNVSIYNAANANLNNVTINGTLTLSSKINIQGNLVNNGSLIAGVNAVNFSGAKVQTISGSSNSQFYDFTANKTGNSLTVNSAQTITNNLTLTAGNLTISAAVSVSSASGQVTLTAGTLAINSNLLSLASGATITRVAGVISTSSPSVGPWNLIYTGVAKATGKEIPASGNLTNLTISTNSGATVTLAAGQPLNVTGSITTNPGAVFTSGANNISVNTIVNNGTFTAPIASATTGLTLSGSLTNNGNFNATTGTIVVAGSVSILGTVPALNNLTVNSSGNFTAPSALTIQGNLQNDGSFNAGSSSITFTGNNAKKIKGSNKITFNNITVNNGTSPIDLGLESAAGADMAGVLTMGVTAIFDTDGAANNTIFTLLSTFDKPTADASIAALPGAGQLPGKITVQRYMGRSGVPQFDYHVWRDISSPVNSTVSDLQNSLPVTGTFTGASSVSGASGASMIRYDETVITDIDGSGSNDVSDGWFDFPADNGNSATTSFTKGQGYQMFIFGTDPPVSTNGNAKWSLRGPVWNGTFNLPVTLTNSGPGGTYSSDNDGWNMVGNPYPSTIDWNAGGWTKTNLDDAIYIDDYATANPHFASYVNGVGTNGGSQYIAMGQGFWVKANAPSPVLTIRETVKAAGTQTTNFRESAPGNLLRVLLASASNDMQNDETVIYFSETATPGYDNKHDALKLMNQQPALNLSSLSSRPSATEKYAINGLPFTNEAQTVPLDIRSVTTGSYHLSFNGLNSFPSSVNIQLQDNFDNTIVDIRQHAKYSFSVDQNKPSSFGSTRFSLTFGGGLEEKPATSAVRAYPNPVNGILTIETSGNEVTTGELFNALGVRISPLMFSGDAQKQTAQYDFSNEIHGIYFIRTNQGGKVSVVRIVKN